MRAAVLTELGAPRPADWPEPSPPAGHAVLDVLAAGLNPLDVTIAAGGFRDGPPPLPSVAGREGVGRLDGRRVYFDRTLPPHGSMAERTVIDPAWAIDVPRHLDDAVAVGLGIAGLAAWLALDRCAGLRPGEEVLVLGASGAVGQIAVQAARLLGAGRVVGACRSSDGRAVACELGVDAAVPLDELDDAAPDVVVDVLWGAPAAAAARVARPGARIVQVGEAAGAEATLPASVLRGRGLAILGFSVFSVPLADRRDAYERMAEHVGRSELDVRVETLPLEHVEEAWRRQQASPHRKLVLVP